MQVQCTPCGKIKGIAYVFAFLKDLCVLSQLDMCSVLPLLNYVILVYFGEILRLQPILSILINDYIHQSSTKYT